MESPLYDKNAEESVLGAILFKPDVVFDVQRKLTAEDFYSQRCRYIYAVMLLMAAAHEPIDIITLGDRLREDGRLGDVDGQSFLMYLNNLSCTAANVMHYAKIVARFSRKRKRKEIGERIAAEAAGDDFDVSKFQTMLADTVSVSSMDEDIKPMSETMLDFVGWMKERQKNEYNGIRTGISKLDVQTHGLNRKDLIILAARPSMGKTALAMNIALEAAKDGNKTLIYSLEMAKERLIARMLANLVLIDSERIMNPSCLSQDEWNAVMDGAKEMAKYPLFITDRRGRTVENIEAGAFLAKGKYGLDFVVIDYLQLIAGSGRKNENRTQEVGHIAKYLQGMAGRLDVPVLALSQLSRSVESRPDKRPMLSDLRESGEIEQAADVIMMMYRDQYYNDNGDDWTELIIKKQRNGKLGTIKLKFIKELTKFEMYGGDYADFGGHRVKEVIA